jgi:hypothetical protein
MKKLSFLLKLLLVFGKKIIRTLFLRKTSFFAEKWHESQKIVIITSSPEASFLKLLCVLRRHQNLCWC